MTLVIAHRTCPCDEAENSLAGIATAERLGADVVEVDVRRTRDGVPVLLHDRWLLRTTGWPVRLDWVDASWATRRRLLDGLRRRGTVPTLAEALTALPGDLRIAIDVKDPGAGPAVVDAVRHAGCGDRVLFWSQHEPALDAARESGLPVEISLLRDTSTPEALERFLADAARLGVHGISAHWSQVGPVLAHRCHELGFLLYAWCRSPAIESGQLALVDGIVSDWPAEARRAVAGLEDRGA